MLAHDKLACLYACAYVQYVGCVLCVCVFTHVISQAKCAENNGISRTTFEHKNEWIKIIWKQTYARKAVCQLSVWFAVRQGEVASRFLSFESVDHFWRTGWKMYVWIILIYHNNIPFFPSRLPDHKTPYSYYYTAIMIYVQGSKLLLWLFLLRCIDAVGAATNKKKTRKQKGTKDWEEGERKKHKSQWRKSKREKMDMNKSCVLLFISRVYKYIFYVLVLYIIYGLTHILNRRIAYLPFFVGEK